MATLFSKIIAGEIPSYMVAQDEYFYAFLDILPQRPGHILVVPKAEVDKIWDAGDEYLTRWLQFARPIAKAIEKAFPCKRCGIAVIGLDVPHAHMHLVPVDSAADLNFTAEKKRASDLELKDAQMKIVEALDALAGR